MSWIILRTRGRHTLRLVESLSEDGFEAWTPIETKIFHVPRLNSKRTVRLPIMPSYVFAGAHNLIDLIQLAAMKVKPRKHHAPAHADFSIMRLHDRIPVIADGHLQSLRLLEAKRTPKMKALQRFASGVSVRVKIEGGSFAGMKGRVEQSDYGMTLVCFDNRMTVKIDTSLLSIDELRIERPVIGMAA